MTKFVCVFVCGVGGACVVHASEWEEEWAVGTNKTREIIE